VTFAKAFWKRFVSEGGLRAGLIRLEEDEFRESRVTDAEAMQVRMLLFSLSSQLKEQLRANMNGPDSVLICWLRYARSQFLR
jgi:hypothetical protein